MFRTPHIELTLSHRKFVHNSTTTYLDLLLHSLQIWDRKSLSCTTVLAGHTKLVMCLQYDDRVIVTGSLDFTIRYSVQWCWGWMVVRVWWWGCDGWEVVGDSIGGRSVTVEDVRVWQLRDVDVMVEGWGWDSNQGRACYILLCEVSR